MKKWQYNNYDSEKGYIPKPHETKEVVIWSEDSPGEDYTDVTTKDERILYKASLYPKKMEDGLIYSNIMNAKLDELDETFFTPEQMIFLKQGHATDEDGVIEIAKDAIDTIFEKTQLFLEGGKWKSSQREIKKVFPSTFVGQDLIDEIKLDIDTYVNTHY